MKGSNKFVQIGKVGIYSQVGENNGETRLRCKIFSNANDFRENIFFSSVCLSSRKIL